MKLPNRSEALFSLKCFIASMLALYIAMRAGLPRPFWAMMTAYVVAHPFAGPVRSKAVYRVGGTILGSLATVLLVPRLAQSPELLSLALALWVGLCLYISLLDRTPRAYVFMLAGYTAALIAFPAMLDPSTIFDVALARVEEIVIGIVCATLVHSLVFPQSLGPVLLARLDKALRDARQWTVDALEGNADALNGRDRRKLAADITDMRVLATHLPFDTSHLRWTARAVHALQERLASMVPQLSAVEDRLQALRQRDAAGLAARWDGVLRQFAAWIVADKDEANSAALRNSIAAAAPAIGRHSSWGQLLELNLAARLQALLDEARQCGPLRGAIDASVRGKLAAGARGQAGVSPRALHLDRRLALMSALTVALAVLASCAFWIATGWHAGSAAPMMAAVLGCFFATMDDPVPAIRIFFKFTLLSAPLSAVYLLLVLPAVHSFEMLALVTAPALLLFGVLMPRPAVGLQATACLFGFLGTLAMQDTGTYDVAVFAEGMVAQLGGIATAALITSLLRSVNGGWTARRLLRAGWRELAELAALSHARQMPAIAEVSARMLDRVALLAPRMAAIAREPDWHAADALGDLRVGLNMAQLLQLPWPAACAPRFEVLLKALAAHYRRRPQRSPGDDAALLGELDAALQLACAQTDWDEQRAAAAALAGMRRDLFAQAPDYQPPASPTLSIKETP